MYAPVVSILGEAEPDRQAHLASCAGIEAAQASRNEQSELGRISGSSLGMSPPGGTQRAYASVSPQRRGRTGGKRFDARRPGRAFPDPDESPDRDANMALALGKHGIDTDRHRKRYGTCGNTARPSTRRASPGRHLGCESASMTQGWRRLHSSGVQAQMARPRSRMPRAWRRAGRVPAAARSRALAGRSRYSARGSR